MAPVKRSAPTAQRETRTTRAAAIAKKNAATSEKKSELKAAGKSAPVTTKTTASNRSGRKTVNTVPAEDENSEVNGDEQSIQVEEPISTRSRATRGTISSTGLAAAPRRRVKITPLNTSLVEKAAPKGASKVTKPKSKEGSTKKTSTRSKATTSVLADEVPAEEIKAKSKRITSTKQDDQKDISKSLKPKTKGRPKAQNLDEAHAVPSQDQEVITSIRATRSQRAESVALEAAGQITDASLTRPSNPIRKKVTFQDVPHEDDKENQPLPQPKAKKVSTKKSPESIEATGMRARPLRKTVVTTAVTRGRKANTNSIEKFKASSTKDKPSNEEKTMPRALTPKKITQIAKSSSPECEEDETSEGEDELNGGKTPVRDLSLSPKRPLSAAIARALSPVKRLDFGQSLVHKSPDRTIISNIAEVDHLGMLASPARRPTASPFKDGMKESPKRGLNDGARLLFPNHHESTSVALAVSTNNASGQGMSTMLQSPKRTGALDPNFFSQSAMKKSVSKSPFKASLLGTPAKRLFSPAKKSSAMLTQKIVEQDTPDQNNTDLDEQEMESEVTASSHFRSSASPLRVMRVEPDTADLNFDDSVLQVRSPLKVQKSPIKGVCQPDYQVGAQLENATSAVGRPTASNICEAVEPPLLGIIQEHPNDVVDHMEGQEDDPVVNQAPHPCVNVPLSDEVVEEKDLLSKSRPDFIQRPSLSQILFRSANAVSDEESSSEDELAGGQTPVKPQTRTAEARNRMSIGMPHVGSATNFGFTPLAAQMSGWLATSPNKSPEQRQEMDLGNINMEFSPLARQHIDGEVVVSRNSTPVQKLNKRSSFQSLSSPKLMPSNRRSLNLRKSLAQRQSMGSSFSNESPVRNTQFDEYMEIRALEEEAAAVAEDENNMIEDDEDQDFNEMMNIESHVTETEDADATILASEEEGSEDESSEPAGDLTTDLINFTHASDTAMVDFKRLADEANELASDEISHDGSGAEAIEPISSFHKEIQPIDAGVEYPEIRGSYDNIVLVAEPSTEKPVTTSQEIALEPESPLLQPVNEPLDSPSMFMINEDDSSTQRSSSPVYLATHSPAFSVIARTPKPIALTDGQRIINTVISKVPLKPEGSISPIKMLRKRSRSFGNSDASPQKRISFEDLRKLSAKTTVENIQSPDRRLRTSTAPSPGGTSTPAARRSTLASSATSSPGNISTVTTPGQMSFAIDDFGDSTLDGIDLPEGFEDSTELVNLEESPTRFSVLSNATTPKAAMATTPATTKRGIRGVSTPLTITKNTPKTARKTPARVSINKSVERTPLAPVGKGALHGATVFVDVHTSEGADASGIFIELLTQMGAKCVKEWRWNPRASFAIDAENELAEQKIGITHVVFKDGGKRTLEKVRDSKGEVCCVGVAWVLDCEREDKWLDESAYQIDTSILPRGGSKRRKSMEPRALLVGYDGSVSASRPRRSVSAEMSELMKRELLNTPARGQTTSLTHDEDLDDENDENLEQSTPTGFVSYDPRTAMTPGTPYLVSQGKKLTQMSAPPKQINKSLFEDEDEENDDSIMEGEKGNAGGVKDAKKFRMKNLGDMAKRRRTLGWKPAVGSPLGRM